MALPLFTELPRVRIIGSPSLAQPRSSRFTSPALGIKAAYSNPTEGRSLKYRTQKRLVTVLTVLLTSTLGHFAHKITKEAPPPEQRTLADDTKEAVFHALVSVIALVMASAVVRWISSRSQA
jgi:hypothetical protein